MLALKSAFAFRRAAADSLFLHWGANLNKNRELKLMRIIFTHAVHLLVL